MKKIKDRMADIKSWPRCSKCRTRDLLVGALSYRCLECDHVGGLHEIQTWATSFACTRSLIDCGVPVICESQVGPYPQTNARPELGAIIFYRQQEAIRDEVFFRYWVKGVRHWVKNKTFQSSAIIWEQTLCVPKHVMAIPSASPSFVEVLRNNSQSADCSMVMFTSDDPKADFSEDPAPGTKYLVANIHHIGVPSICISIETESISKEARLQDVFPTYHRTAPKSLIYQPVDWNIVYPEYGQEQLRLAIGFNSEAGSTNVTFSVKEDMDTGVFTSEASVRTPGNSVPINMKAYEPAGNLQDAVSAIKEKAESMKNKVEEQTGARVDWEYNMEFENTDHHYSVMAAITGNSLWNQFVKHKADLDKEGH